MARVETPGADGPGPHPWARSPGFPLPGNGNYRFLDRDRGPKLRIGALRCWALAFFKRYVIRALSRSYGLISIFTKSPVVILMKCFLSFPEM